VRRHPRTTPEVDYEYDNDISLYGQIVSLDVVHPLQEAVATEFADHLGEATDVPGEGVQLRCGRWDPDLAGSSK
jgi:hypothetical protein